MYAYAGAFKPGPIAPLAKPGENILLVDRETFHLYGVAFVEPLAPSHVLIFNAGAILAGARALNQNTQPVLDQNYGQLAQIRMRVLDDIHFVIKQPQAVARQGDLNVTAEINAYTHLYDPYDALTEMFIFENQRFFMDITNPRQQNLAQARIAFYGYKYVLIGKEGSGGNVHLTPLREFYSPEEAIQAGLRFTTIPEGGWGR